MGAGAPSSDDGTARSVAGAYEGKNEINVDFVLTLLQR
jgi:hypothetical protein